jgi:hypothetical protein
MNTAMMDTRCATGTRRFVVEAGNADPANQHQYEGDELIDRKLHTCRTTANRAARSFLQRGLWVEVYDDALMATSNSPTYGHPNSPRQDGVDYGFWGRI